MQYVTKTGPIDKFVLRASTKGLSLDIEVKESKFRVSTGNEDPRASALTLIVTLKDAYLADRLVKVKGVVPPHMPGVPAAIREVSIIKLKRPGSPPP